MFNVVMGKLLFWVMIRENQGAHNERDRETGSSPVTPGGFKGIRRWYERRRSPPQVD